MINLKSITGRPLAVFGLALFGVMQSANTFAECHYSISNEWSTGYTGTITIANNTDSPISSWNVAWQYSSNTISSAWNANLSGSNPYTAASLGWNGNIQPGNSVEFGFQVDKNGGSAEQPVVNGDACNDGVPASSSSISAASSSSSISSSSPSVSSVANSSSSADSGGQCNWYGTLYPLCATTQSGWGWENSSSCIARTTCNSQPNPYGVVGENASSSSVAISSSSSLSSSSERSSSSDFPSSSSSSISSSSSTSSLPLSSSNSSSSSVSSSQGSSASGLLFEDDFESDLVGQQPARWGNFIGWIGNGPNPNGNNFALVESGRSVSGDNAVHFSGGQNPAMITRGLPAGINTVYIRAWVYMTRQLGMNPGDNHETLVALRGSAGNANDEVRFGEIKGVIGTNEVPSDNIAPTMDSWGDGPVFASDTWHCMEVAFLSAPAYDEVHAWINGTLVHSITNASDWNNGPLAADWLDGKFNEIVFGWHSFSQNEVDVWMDDISIATHRIGGCE